ncbi:MAG: hypothetical protein V4577_24230 [Bacteroidota bacterium]
MSESEYKEFVLADYDRQVGAHLLLSELLVPTPANIKAEIVKFCEQGSALSAGDEQILRSFVGTRADAAAYRIAFLNGTADPFRPLINLLAERSKGTNIRNVNLLALLVGFKPRPYHPTMVRKDTTDGPIIVLPTSPPRVDPPPVDPLQKNRKKLIIYTLVSLAVVIGGYFTYDYLAHRLTGNERCMYWDDDHYQPIDCNEKPPHSQSQPIVWQLVDGLKRITKPDTLTPYSVRKVWYIQYNGKVEFFTGEGLYPPDTSRRLLPMTDHILKKYVYHIAD